MSIRLCDRCEGVMLKEEIMLDNGSVENKSVSLYRCDRCGRLEFDTADLAAARPLTEPEVLLVRHYCNKVLK